MANYSIDILNSIRAEASQEFLNRIPMATIENFAAVGIALQTYPTLFNEFCDALMNKIGKTILIQKMFKNPLARFKSGEIVSQQDVEEIFVEMAKAEGAYDPDGKNPLGRRVPSDTKVIYHRQNRQDYYAISIGDIDFSRVFRSPATLDSFIKAQINSVYSADQYDEWMAMKMIMAAYSDQDTDEVYYFDYEVPYDNPSIPGGLDGKEWSNVFIKTLRKAVQDVSFPSTKYNAAGVMTWSNPSELVLLINKDALVHIDVDTLASAFHQSNTDLKVVPTIIPMDDFSAMTETVALLVDKEWFRIWDTLVHMEPQRNAQGLFTNYFLHHHQIMSLSKFKNAVRFLFATND